MQPVTDQLDALLTGGKINVTVYEGQLDLICATVGQERYMARSKWAGMARFNSSQKVGVYYVTLNAIVKWWVC